MSTKKRIRKPRTEAQKAARRERDRKRREAVKKNTPSKNAKRSSNLSYNKNVSPKLHVGVIAVAKNERKRLVKITVIKEYEID